MKLSLSTPFNLNFTLCCGQAFRWINYDDWWYGIIRDKAVKIRQRELELEFENMSTQQVKTYFGLNDDLNEIFSQINKDPHINNILNFFSGLRILRQDPWECLISFICATNKNLEAIKKMIFNLSKKFGEKIIYDDYTFYTFPSKQNISKASLKDLTSCGLGYRAKYLSETAKKIYYQDLIFKQIKKSSYEDARKKLTQFPGVGLKVADCILLFSLGYLEAFPIDIRIKRTLVKYYSENFSEKFLKKLNSKSMTPSEYKKLNLFGRKYFGKYAGYAQEYLYHYERTKS